MKRNAVITFVITEIVLYIVFMTMDLLPAVVSTIVLKYIGVLLCVGFSALCAMRGGKKLIPAAQGFTAVADFFLLVIDDFYIVGLLFFLVVQSIYLYYLFKETGKIWIPVRAACLVLIVAVIWIANLMNSQDLVAGIYFSMILVNMAMSWIAGGRERRLFAVGLSLFVCCDICVGLYNLYWLLPDGLYAFTRIGMWMFYLPSQVLISLSMLKRGER